MSKRQCRCVLLAGYMLATGCSDHRVAGLGDPAPSVSDVAVALNPYNNLSTVLTFRVTNADSVRIVYSAQRQQSLATPYYTMPARRIATLGLEPSTTYAYVVEALAICQGRLP